MTRAAWGRMSIVAAGLLMAAAASPDDFGLRPARASDQTATRDVRVQPRGRASITGVVVTDESPGRSVRRVRVELSGGGAPNRAVLTDDQGRYAFHELPAGRYSIAVSKAGYVRSQHGARRPWRAPGVPIDLTEGQRRTDLVTVIQRGGAITGRVLDGHGQPMAGARVSVHDFARASGVETLSTIASSPSGSDDRGVYRVYGVPPGQYLVSAVPMQSPSGVRVNSDAELQWAANVVAAARGRGGSGATEQDAPPDRGMAVTYVPVFFPGTPDPTVATRVTVVPGSVAEGVDVVAQLVPAARVAGTVRAPEQVPPSTIVLALSRRGAGPLETPEFQPAQRGPVNASSRGFEFSNVPPGAYVLTGRASSQPQVPNAPRIQDLWAELDVYVNGQDLEDLSLEFHPGTTVSGMVVYESERGAVAPSQATVRLTTSGMVPAMGVAPSVTIARDFILQGVAPGSYRLMAGVTNQSGLSVRRWMPRSAMYQGRDLLDEPLLVSRGDAPSGIVVTFTDAVTELTGRILDAQDKPVTEFFVMAFAADRSRWRPGSRYVRTPQRPGTDGRFAFADLPPGKYLLAALADYDASFTSDPAFLEAVSAGAIEVTIAPGETTVQDIRVRGSDLAFQHGSELSVSSVSRQTLRNAGG